LGKKDVSGSELFNQPMKDHRPRRLNRCGGAAFSALSGTEKYFPRAFYKAQL
jgi:hypothetical protein